MTPQEAIKMIRDDMRLHHDNLSGTYRQALNMAVTALEKLDSVPPAQPERDTPRKPTETTSRMWGIREKEPVCPKCGYYLGHWRFQSKRITYCESCGQAIDWEGWDSDE